MRMLDLGVALFCFCLACASAGAQSVGDKWPDRTGLYVHYADNADFILRLDAHHFRMIFLDDRDFVVASPFRRVVVHVDRRGRKNNDLNLILRPDDGAACLIHPRFIKPPYTFRVRILLYPHDDDDEGVVSVPMTPFVWQE